MSIMTLGGMAVFWNELVAVALAHGREAAVLMILAEFDNARDRRVWVRMIDYVMAEERTHD